MTEEHEAKIEAMTAEHEAEVSALQESAREAEERFETELMEQKTAAAMKLEAVTSELNSELSLCKASLQSAINRGEELEEKNRLAEARIKALGGIDRDYTDKESFGMLEAEYNAFTKIYKEQWSLAKKKIIRKYLNINNIKGQKDKNEERRGDNTSD
jgi:hypothetical protein